MRSRPTRLDGGKTEVPDFHRPVIVQENVVALKVTMYYVLGVQVTKIRAKVQSFLLKNCSDSK